MISVGPNILAALEADNQAEAVLVKLPGSLYLTDWAVDLPYDSSTYKADGTLTELSNVTREPGLSLHSYTVTLSGVDQTILALYANNNFAGLEATIYRVFLDDSGAIIDGFALVDYIGTLDAWSMAEDGTKSELNLKLTNDWAAYEFSAGRYTNPASQEAKFPGDTFFDMAHEDKPAIGWGRE